MERVTFGTIFEEGSHCGKVLHVSPPTARLTRSLTLCVMAVSINDCSLDQSLVIVMWALGVRYKVIGRSHVAYIN
jgi:hypothetical protein